MRPLPRSFGEEILDLAETQPRDGEAEPLQRADQHDLRAAIRRGDGVAAQQVLGESDRVDHARSSSLIEVLERVCASTRFTITAQARFGPGVPSGSGRPGSVPGTTTE